MMLKFFVAAAIVVAVPLVASAQEDNSNAQPWKPSIEEAQKLIKTISDDKDKLKVYCELGKLHEEIEKAEEDNDTKYSTVFSAGLLGSNSKLGPTTYGSWMDWGKSIQTLMKVRSSLRYSSRCKSNAAGLA